MPNTRILFVDDENNVLEGLQRMLRPHRREWDMVFAHGGEEALQLLAQQSFNVVVSDMRMPGMDGMRLLTQVRRLYPDVVRILLSGHSDRGMLLQSAGLAHQFLAKPCKPELLKTTVAQACRLRALLQQEPLRRLVSRIDVLPSLPAPYLELLKELRSPEASVEKVGRIIARDMGMTAKVLQLVNSAFFGLRKQVADPAAAAALLGLDSIKALVLSVQVFRQLDQVAASVFSVEQLWEHSVNTGAFAQAIAREEGQSDQFIGDALMAGMLHDIGKLVLATRFSSEWEAVMTSSEGFDDVCAAERHVFGATHAEVGAYLLGLWGMMDPIVEAVAFHHEPPRTMVPYCSVMTIVCAANLIDHDLNTAAGGKSSAQFDFKAYADTPMAEKALRWHAVCAAIEKEHLKCMRKSF